MRDAAEMRRWVLARASGWRALIANISAVRQRGDATLAQAVAAVEAYRGLARDLATARRVAPHSRTTAGLETLYLQLHALINRKPRGGRAAFSAMLFIDVPAAVRDVRAKILGMGVLMAASALAGWWLISTFPDLISLIAGNRMIEQVEQGHLWTEGLINVVPSSVLSVNILANNIMVSVLAFCAGIFLGLATFYLVAFNGLMLGAVFAFVHQHGLGAALFSFIAAHGPVELSVICIAGACGIALGESIIRPSLATRRDSFQVCARRLTPLLMLCALLLVGCGFIEGFISPDPAFPLPSRIGIGVAYWCVMLILLSGKLLRTPP